MPSDGSAAWCEGVAVEALATAIGTPLYYYSEAILRQRAAALREGVRQANAPDALIAFAVKANGNPTLLRVFGELGLGADVTGGGELFLARHAAIPPDRIIFSGVAKSEGEIDAAIHAGIHALHVESASEMAQIGAIAFRRQQIARVSVRVNPDVDAATHPYMTTGRRSDKFGVNPDTAASLLHEAGAHRWLDPVGLGAHIGSQIRDLAPYRAAVGRLVALAERLRAEGLPLRTIDGGGGWGLDYEGGDNGPAALTAWATAVAAPIAVAGFQPILEPGRSLIGPAGWLLTRVVRIKQQGDTRFVIVDAGMNDLIRPALYNAHHPIHPVNPRPGPLTPVDIVGPLCESGDFLARQRPLPPLEPGDLLTIGHAGAYGYAMSSNYNGRLRPPELLITHNHHHLIRPRETLAALLGPYS